MSEEPAWEALEPLPVTMHVPTFGEQPTERTEFRIGHDDHYVYASGRMYDSDPGGIRASSLKRDDPSFSNDWFIVNLDTFNDKENTSVFGGTPAGVRTDAILANDGAGPAGHNFTWNTFWDLAVSRNEQGWFAEIRIPFTSLRFQDRAGAVVMGVTLVRNIARKAEIITFPAIEPRWGFRSFFKASQMQEVVLKGVHRRRPLYVTPYSLGGLGQSFLLNDNETGYDRVDDTVLELGGDAKLGVTSNLTLDLTVNTDFAQVEADNQQVNLTRFSLFFPEKRLFFQERAAVFDYSLGGNDRLFYSRRIGISNGKQVPIYGGARLVGRVGRWDIGFLDMQTAELEQLPTENLGVLRIRRQLLNENSYVGGIVTSRIDGEGGYNLVYGLDGIIRFAKQDYLTLNWAQSFDAELEGGTGALDRGLARLHWERRGVDGLAYSLQATRVGSSFQPELGFLLRNDHVRVGDRISYGWRPGKESPFLLHTLGLNGSLYRRNGDGTIESAHLGPELVMETKAGHELTASVFMFHEDLEEGFSLSEDVEVPAGRHRFYNGRLAFSSPYGGLLQMGVTLETGSFYDGWKTSVSATPTWKLSRHLELSGQYRLDHIDFGDRNQQITAHVAHFRARVTLSTRLLASSFVQFSSADDAVIVNARLRFNPREGNDLYLVYNEGLNTSRFGFEPVRPRTSSRTLLLKYSHTFQMGF